MPPRSTANWAGPQGLGLNAIRINLPYLVWKHDRDGLIDRLDRVMGNGRGTGLIDTIPVLVSTIAASAVPDATLRPPSPTRGRVSTTARAVASPRPATSSAGPANGAAFSTITPATWSPPSVSDPRILLWDVYNPNPANRMVFGPEGRASATSPTSHRRKPVPAARQLRRGARDRARSSPDHRAPGATPLAGATEAAYETEVDRTALEAVRYRDLPRLPAERPRSPRSSIALARRGRPMLCTEWMARPVGSRSPTRLPLLSARAAWAACTGGCVQGRTQTWCALARRVWSRPMAAMRTPLGLVPRPADARGHAL